VIRWMLDFCGILIFVCVLILCYLVDVIQDLGFWYLLSRCALGILGVSGVCFLWLSVLGGFLGVWV